MESTALGFVLQLSRWVGLAPYVRKPDYGVSRAVDIIGKIVYTCTSVYAVIVTTHVTFFNETYTLLIIDTIHSASRIFSAIICLIGIYTASGRIASMFRCLEQLHLIESNISCRRETRGDRKMYFAVVILFFGTLIVRAVNIYFYTGKYIVLQWVHLLEFQIVTLLQLQLVAFGGRVLETLEMVNKSLEQLNPDSNLHPEGTSDEITIRQLAIHYFNICEIVKTTNKRDGYLMAMLLVVNVLHLQIASHKIIIWCSNYRNESFHLLVPSITRSIIRASSLAFCTETFHQTHVQMSRTHQIVKSLKCRRTDERRVENELEMLTRVLVLNETTYSPLSMCTLSRSLVIKIFGSLVTYLVIVLTYGPEAKKPSLVFKNTETLL